MKQRKHKPTPERLTSPVPTLSYSNHSPKRLQRLRHALNHFDCIRLGLQEPMRKRSHSPVFGLLRMSAALSAVMAPGPVLVVPPHFSEEDQALIHLENYRRMVAVTL